MIVYGITIFTGAALLFVVQPMVGRMVLPLLGGSPAVWNTAMVFYQAVLLAGYAYAHFTTRWLGVRRQTALHAVMLVLPLFVMPVVIQSEKFTLMLEILLVARLLTPHLRSIMWNCLSRL